MNLRHPPLPLTRTRSPHFAKSCDNAFAAAVLIVAGFSIGLFMANLLLR